MTNAPQNAQSFHRMRKIEVVIRAEDHQIVENLLETSGIGGWTMIRDVAGMGHGGFHKGKTIFNDQTGLVMYVAVAEPKVIADVARGFGRVFETRAGVTFLSDVEVLRSDYFAASQASLR